MDSKGPEDRTSPILHYISPRTSANSEHSATPKLEHPHDAAVDIRTVQDGMNNGQPADNFGEPRGDSGLSACNVVDDDRSNEGQYTPLTMDAIHQHDAQLQYISGLLMGRNDQPVPRHGFGTDSSAPALYSPYTLPVPVSSGPDLNSKAVFGARPPHIITPQNPLHSQYLRIASSCNHIWQHSSDTIHEDDQPDGDTIRCESVGWSHARDPSKGSCMNRGSPPLINISSSTAGSGQEITAWGNDLAGVGSHVDNYGYPEYADDRDLIID